MKNEYLNVKDINKYIKTVFDENTFLKTVYIKGEISNFKYHTTGHLYFSLKDDESKINAVMFNFNKNNLKFIPKDGDSVLVKGRVSVYEAAGSYQIYVEEMLEDGTGDLYVIFEKLKKRLFDEGYFNEEHKLKIPKMPSSIGVITASTGAAVKDIISTINRRFPLSKIYLFPTLVQGSLAKENIVKMIEKADTCNLDVIILGRGGGSIEDLWAFNEEIVAKAVYNCKTPIISAVGHEIDFTICDFVSDKRAPTPTGAAEMAVPDKNDIFRYLEDARIRLNSSINSKITKYNEKLNYFKSNHLLNNPKNIYIQYEQKMDTIIDKINNSMLNNIERNKNRLNNLALKVDLLNPNNLLDKGYSLCYVDGKIINSKTKISINDEITIKLKNKNIISNVKEIKENGK